MHDLAPQLAALGQLAHEVAMAPPRSSTKASQPTSVRERSRRREDLAARRGGGGCRGRCGRRCCDFDELVEAEDPPAIADAEEGVERAPEDLVGALARDRGEAGVEAADDEPRVELEPAEVRGRPARTGSRRAGVGVGWVMPRRGRGSGR